MQVCQIIKIPNSEGRMLCSSKEEGVFKNIAKKIKRRNRAVKAANPSCRKAETSLWTFRHISNAGMEDFYDKIWI